MYNFKHEIDRAVWDKAQVIFLRCLLSLMRLKHNPPEERDTKNIKGVIELLGLLNKGHSIGMGTRCFDLENITAWRVFESLKFELPINIDSINLIHNDLITLLKYPSASALIDKCETSLSAWLYASLR